MNNLNVVVVSTHGLPPPKKRLPQGWSFLKEYDKWFGMLELPRGSFAYRLHPEWEPDLVVMLEVSVIIMSLNERQRI